MRSPGWLSMGRAPRPCSESPVSLVPCLAPRLSLGRFLSDLAPDLSFGLISTPADVDGDTVTWWPGHGCATTFPGLLGMALGCCHHTNALHAFFLTGSPRPDRTYRPSR